MQHKILSILEIDQKNIKLIKAGDITSEEFKKRADKTSADFYVYYKEEGFPYKSDNEESVYRGAIALTLHQPLERLEEIYNVLKEQVHEKVERRDLAFMVDKIAVNKGEKQVYGTQYKVVDGEIEFLPIENPENLDKRRGEMCMESHQDYIQVIKSL